MARRFVKAPTKHPQIAKQYAASPKQAQQRRPAEKFKVRLDGMPAPDCIPCKKKKQP